MPVDLFTLNQSLHGRNSSKSPSISGAEAANRSAPRAASSSPSPLFSVSASLFRHFNPDSSIVLVGIRGSGLSTLAVMAASALGFRLLDADQHFYDTTGLSRARYKSTRGISAYKQEEMRLLSEMLLENPSSAIIVCGPGAVEASGQALLANYSQSHPVIYVSRDPESIRQYLCLPSIDKITTLTRLSAPILRSLSNFEFYNLSDLAQPPRHLHPSGRYLPKSLALKQLELDFLHLLNSLKKNQNQLQRTRGQDKSYSPSLSPIEDRLFTHALTIPISISDSFWAKVLATDVTADAVELVVTLSDSSFNNSLADYVSRQFYNVRRTIRLPIIIHVLAKETQYFSVLHHCLRLAPEFLTVNLNSDDDLVKQLVAHKGATKYIGHKQFETTGWTDPDRERSVERAEMLELDLVRLCQEATMPVDNFSPRHFADEMKASGKRIPVIAYYTGPFGKLSRCYNTILSPVTSGLVIECSGPSSLLSTQETLNALYSSFALDSMYFGIYGTSTSSSFSPAMHNPAFRLYGLPHNYSFFQRPTIDYLKQLIKDPHFGGASISSPFKTEVLSLVDYMSPEARVIGAVNTLIPLRSNDPNSLMTDRSRAGPCLALFGENTDWIGVSTCIRSSLSPINAVRRRTTGLVVGAGGMARAATYALIRLGVQTIFVHNRTQENAESLVSHFHNYISSVEDDSYGDRNRETGKKAVKLRIMEKKTDKWPKDEFDYPTIIVSCIATTQLANGDCSADTSLPANWLASETGGVAVEVS